MRALFGVVSSAVFLTGFCVAAHAQQLPKSGSIEFHTGWRDSAEVMQVAEKRIQGHSRTTGATFNDKGSGPLHLGPANCFATFDLADGKGPAKGTAHSAYADGDRIFTDFTGTLGGTDGANGTNMISGGT